MQEAARAGNMHRIKEAEQDGVGGYIFVPSDKRACDAAAKLRPRGCSSSDNLANRR